MHLGCKLFETTWWHSVWHTSKQGHYPQWENDAHNPVLQALCQAAWCLQPADATEMRWNLTYMAVKGHQSLFEWMFTLVPGSGLYEFWTPLHDVRREARDRQVPKPRVDNKTMRMFMTLDIGFTRDPVVLLKAYRSKLKQVHPDQGGTREQFEQVQEAYAYLKKVTT